ncbi:F-box/FBD/LRR-repeat protein At1g13570-like isoform X1 [Rhododendron vialii]|uniref:F-box/FBD/LRR-repeat protein At1g13570-like isoform X1 n=1 Tax=Rhododendron vialii TaxID=182163 RepID=UPI00265F72E6|nr:F-box/FBD/LRR-repeat protein At1g13570-like isoform X1 [Rhododendron vialii]XP_058193525.1 F-box/FBD/LRR-repeat protein At1g13570-like isoform X1 [Rhododendron vialii]
MKNMCGSFSDGISNLPNIVIEKILVLMPLRDAVRTSLLSKKWRYNWITIPELVFDDTSLVDPSPIFSRQRLPPDQLSSRNRLFATIYHVLLLHRGAILKFILSISELKSCSEIDALITILSSNGIQELALKIWKGDPHKLPPSLFSFQQLTHLNLQFCVLKLPTTFKGFPRMVCLELHKVIITADKFQTFISSCPILEQLTFESSTCFDFIGIDAPNLKVLSFIGIFKSLKVKNAPHLANFSIDSKASVGIVERGGDKFGWAGFFDSLPVLKNLHMGGQYLMSLGEAGLGRRLLTSWGLNFLELSDVRLGVQVVCWTVLGLIKISPKLRKVIIKPITTGNEYEVAVLKYCEVNMNRSKFYLNHLREVEMCLVSGTPIELQFMKLLLAKSRVLESMVVKPDPAKVFDGGLTILKELSQFQRLSPKAKIMYKDTNK